MQLTHITCQVALQITDASVVMFPYSLLSAESVQQDLMLQGSASLLVSVSPPCATFTV